MQGCEAKTELLSVITMGVAGLLALLVEPLVLSRGVDGELLEENALAEGRCGSGDEEAELSFAGGAGMGRL